MYYIYNGEVYSEDELIHHGILGQKWGVRRFQNQDGSLKPAGEKRYNDDRAKKIVKRLNKNDEKIVSLKYKRESLKQIDSKNKQRLDAAKKAHQEAEKSGNGLKRFVYKHGAKIAQNAFDSSHKKLMSNQKAIRDGEDTTKRLLSDAKKAGYKIDSSKVDRLVNRGQEYAMTAASMLINKTPSTAIMGYEEIDSKRQYRKGTAYRLHGTERKLDDRQIRDAGIKRLRGHLRYTDRYYDRYFDGST